MSEEAKDYDVIKRNRDGQMFRVPPEFLTPAGYTRVMDAHEPSGRLKPQYLSIERLEDVAARKALTPKAEEQELADKICLSRDGEKRVTKTKAEMIDELLVPALKENFAQDPPIFSSKQIQAVEEMKAHSYGAAASADERGRMSDDLRTLRSYYEQEIGGMSRREWERLMLGQWEPEMIDATPAESMHKVEKVAAINTHTGPIKAQGEVVWANDVRTDPENPHLSKTEMMLRVVVKHAQEESETHAVCYVGALTQLDKAFKSCPFPPGTVYTRGVQNDGAFLVVELKNGSTIRFCENRSRYKYSSADSRRYYYFDVVSQMTETDFERLSGAHTLVKKISDGAGEMRKSEPLIKRKEIPRPVLHISQSAWYHKISDRAAAHYGYVNLPFTLQVMSHAPFNPKGDWRCSFCKRKFGHLDYHLCFGPDFMQAMTLPVAVSNPVRYGSNVQINTRTATRKETEEYWLRQYVMQFERDKSKQEGFTISLKVDMPRLKNLTCELKERIDAAFHKEAAALAERIESAKEFDPLAYEKQRRRKARKDGAPIETGQLTPSLSCVITNREGLIKDDRLTQEGRKLLELLKRAEGYKLPAWTPFAEGMTAGNFAVHVVQELEDLDLLKTVQSNEMRVRREAAAQVIKKHVRAAQQFEEERKMKLAALEVSAKLESERSHVYGMDFGVPRGATVQAIYVNGKLSWTEAGTLPLALASDAIAERWPDGNAVALDKTQLAEFVAECVSRDRAARNPYIAFTEKIGSRNFVPSQNGWQLQPNGEGYVYQMSLPPGILNNPGFPAGTALFDPHSVADEIEDKVTESARQRGAYNGATDEVTVSTSIIRQAIRDGIARVPTAGSYPIGTLSCSVDVQPLNIDQTQADIVITSQRGRGFKHRLNLTTTWRYSIQEAIDQALRWEMLPDEFRTFINVISVLHQKYEERQNKASSPYTEQSMIDLRVAAAEEITQAVDKFWATPGRMRTRENVAFEQKLMSIRSNILALDPARFTLKEHQK